MNRIDQIMLCAERTNINKHIAEYNIINCTRLHAKISERTCRLNCARAYCTKKTLKARNGNPVWMKTNWILQCIDCKRYKKPTSLELAEVMTGNGINYNRRTKDVEKRNMARASSVARNLTRLHDTSTEILSSDTQESGTDETDRGKHKETPLSNDIFDVGVCVDIDEVLE